MKQAELHYTAQNSPWPQQNKVMSTQTVNTSGNSPHLTFSSTYHPALFWTGRRFQSAAGGPFFFLLLIKTGQHATVYVKHILLKVTKVIANTKEEVFTKGRNKPSGVRASRSMSTRATAQLFLLSVQKCETKYFDTEQTRGSPNAPLRWRICFQPPTPGNSRAPSEAFHRSTAGFDHSLSAPGANNLFPMLWAHSPARQSNPRTSNSRDKAQQLIGTFFTENEEVGLLKEGSFTPFSFRLCLSIKNTFIPMKTSQLVYFPTKRSARFRLPRPRGTAALPPPSPLDAAETRRALSSSPPTQRAFLHTLGRPVGEAGRPARRWSEFRPGRPPRRPVPAAPAAPRAVAVPRRPPRESSRRPTAGSAGCRLREAARSPRAHLPPAKTATSARPAPRRVLRATVYRRIRPRPPSDPGSRPLRAPIGSSAPLAPPPAEGAARSVLSPCAARPHQWQAGEGGARDGCRGTWGPWGPCGGGGRAARGACGVARHGTAGGAGRLEWAWLREWIAAGVNGSGDGGFPSVVCREGGRQRRSAGLRAEETFVWGQALAYGAVPRGLPSRALPGPAVTAVVVIAVSSFPARPITGGSRAARLRYRRGVFARGTGLK